MKVPGPGSYNHIKEFGNNNNAVLVRSRLMFFYGNLIIIILDIDLKAKKHCISPQKYFPSTKIIENMRFTSIGFGKGERTPTVNPSVKKNPGPGTYNLPTIFTKNRKSKFPLN